ncbi:hypothetical protein [Bacillus cereus]|uniref:hypothetical protein n=1 Tax=Bacillus cereus TaxID=1396 RepID=UPI003012E658
MEEHNFKKVDFVQFSYRHDHAVFCKIKVQSIAAKFPACNFTWRRGHDSLSRHASY